MSEFLSPERVVRGRITQESPIRPAVVAEIRLPVTCEPFPSQPNFPSHGPLVDGADPRTIEPILRSSLSELLRQSDLNGDDLDVSLSHPLPAVRRCRRRAKVHPSA